MTMLNLKGILEARQLLQDVIHSFFRTRAYLSIDTPVVVLSPGTEVHLSYFASDWVDFTGKSHALYLRSSPELHLKQALSLGLDRVYHLGKCFRNRGELSPWHHPEFTMLEWYEAGISLPEFMDLTELLISEASLTMKRYFSAAWAPPPKILRLSVFEAFDRWAGIKLEDGDQDLAAKGRALGYTSLREGDSFEDAYFKILLDVIEPEIKKLEAVFLYDYPASQCALARVQNDRAQRFELYIKGVELCNAFDELIDPRLNEERIQKSNAQREALGSEKVPEDPDFYAALARGLPASCGNALGFDRLLALLLELPSLDQVIPFRWNEPYQRFKDQQSPL